jgi:hypothetical protein
MIIRELPLGGSDIRETLLMQAMNGSKAVVASPKNAMESFGIGHKAPPAGLSFVLLLDCDWQSWESSAAVTGSCDDRTVPVLEPAEAEKYFRFTSRNKEYVYRNNRTSRHD